MKTRIALLCTGLLAAFVAMQQATAAPIIFDFESDTLGVQPAGWASPFGSSVGGGGIVSDAQAAGGSQSLLVRGTGGTARSVGRPGSFSLDRNVLSIDLYAPGTNGTTGNNFFIGLYGGLRFDLYQNGSADTIDLFLNPTGGPRFGGINRDEWFNLQFEFDWDNGLVDAFLNSSQLVDDLVFTPDTDGGPRSDLTFQGMHSHGAGGVAGHTYVDNISLSESSATVSEPSAFMILFAGIALMRIQTRRKIRRNCESA